MSFETGKPDLSEIGIGRKRDQVDLSDVESPSVGADEDTEQFLSRPRNRNSSGGGGLTDAEWTERTRQQSQKAVKRARISGEDVQQEENRGAKATRKFREAFEGNK